ncbi:hypothetical protein [Companilactobacillus nuruki]|uniref:Prepilin-type cleavage/methylation domain-containing protein n=1 Tax=Companilactobacillus nuruki TaxID=1993540 RepID=A0A2N7ATV0_9LACO|nr:hypothetical protein [Companilactobacillus nuruki]PMD70218.1 hypothetical protein CBP76_06930 [Companilactobacillus nuruki]
MIQSRKAFTLLETVISLTIFCSLIIISTINLKDYHAQVEEKQAIESFKNTFKSSFNYCYLNKMALKIYVDKTENIISFNAVGNGSKDLNKAIIKKVKFPKTLSIVKFENGYTIGNSGQAAPATIIFNSQLTNKTYTYKIQLGWGEIVEKT